MPDRCSFRLLQFRPRRAQRMPGGLAVAALVVLSPGLTGQLQLDDLRKRHLPEDDDATLAIATGDVDGDGDTDLIVGNDDPRGRSGRQNRLYLNDGSGRFTDATAGRIPTTADRTTAMALGDVDADGDLDLVVANYASLYRGAQNTLYLNDGSGIFTDSTTAQLPARVDSSSSVCLGDVDGDGDLDLVFGNGPYSSNTLYLNNGSGRFTDATAARMPRDADATCAVGLGDVDGDGDADLVIGNMSYSTYYGGSFAPQNKLYLNDGTGTFSDATAARLPADMDDTRAMAIGDVDGDGDADLVFANHDRLNAPGQQNRLYLNDGTGHFTNATATRMPTDQHQTRAVGLGDVDGDGDADLVLGNGGQQNRVYLNDGAGVFSDATAGRMPTHDDTTRATALFDVDTDGDADVVVGNIGQNRLYLNDGTGHFGDGSAARLPAGDRSTWGVALGDVDGDGDADLVFANGWAQNQLALNDGSARFVNATAARMPAEDDVTRGAALGDVDADGDLDLVLANGDFLQANRDQNRLYLNDGNGTFNDATTLRMPVDTDESFAVVLGDVDGDSDIDLVFGNTGRFSGKQNRLYLNDGTGRFIDATQQLPPDTDLTTTAVLGDVDADGDLDLVFGNQFSGGSSTGQNRLYLNDGTGRFTDATPTNMPVDVGTTTAVALVDVNGDRAPDLLLGNHAAQNRLYLNDGNGHFTDVTAARMPIISDTTLSVALGDLDNDGDPDLVVGNNGPTELYLNDGTGAFTEVATARMAALCFSSAMRWADVDGDRDLDLIVGNLGQNRLLSNLLGQLDTPFLVGPGREYQVDVFARYRPPGTTVIGLPYISPGTAQIPLSTLGTLGLDPTQMLALPPVAIQQPTGVATSAFTVPNLAAIVAVTVYAQAVLVQSPLQARLTNVSLDLIAPY